MEKQHPVLRQIRALESHLVPKKNVIHSTHIEDIPIEGYELSEEHLRLASGGISLDGGGSNGTSVGTTSSTIQTDDD